MPFWTGYLRLEGREETGLVTECVHYWKVDSRLVGVCEKCGARKQFRWSRRMQKTAANIRSVLGVCAECGKARRLSYRRGGSVRCECQEGVLV